MQKRTEQALQEFEKYLRCSGVDASGFLPPERALCELLNIGRGALRAIFEELILQRRLIRVPGKGVKLLFNDGNDTDKLRKFMLVMPRQNIYGHELMEIIQGAAGAASEQNAELLLFFNKDDSLGNPFARHLADGACDGVIFIEVFTPAMRASIEGSSMKYIVANYEGGMEDVPSVRVDYRAIGRLAGRHLIEHGYRRVQLLGKEYNPYIYKQMYAGLKGAMAEDDLAPEPVVMLKNDTERDFDVVGRLMTKMVEESRKSGERYAFFAGRDWIGHRVWDVAQKLGMRIPEDFGVIGYDDNSWSYAAQAGLTTIEQPTQLVGTVAFETLFQAVVQNMDVVSSVWPGNIIERSSL